MKSFGLVGSMVAMAAGTVYLWDSAPGGAAPEAPTMAAELPAIAEKAMAETNERVAALQKAIKEDAARQAQR